MSLRNLFSLSWDEAQAKVSGGASQNGKKPPYLETLKAVSYPALQRLYEGEWSRTTISCCQAMIQNGITHGSYPLLVAALCPLSDKQRSSVLGKLSDAQRQRLSFLLTLAEADPTYTPLFAARVELPSYNKENGRKPSKVINR